MHPHNVPMTVLGAGILWFGWFGFNAGSALGANGLAANAFVVTHLSAAAAGLSWAAAEWVHQRRPTTLGVASGAVAGLVAITPASGFVGPMSAILIGIAAGRALLSGRPDEVCACGTTTAWTWSASTEWVGSSVRWPPDCWRRPAINAAGADGALFGNPVLLVKQVVAVVAVVIWSFALSYGLLRAIEAVMGLRVDADEEEIGLDLSQHNETAYVFGSSSGRIHHDERVVRLRWLVEPSPVARLSSASGRGRPRPAPLVPAPRSRTRQ